MTKQKARDLICECFQLMGEKYSSPEAERIMLAIAYQESGFEHRKQIGGPARGFWQFERGGGVVGVMNHPSVKDEAKRICEALDVDWDKYYIHVGLSRHDLLAACFARLLLWTIPGPIPTTEDEAWDYYLEGWRPGKPHRNRWTDNWKKSEI